MVPVTITRLVEVPLVKVCNASSLAQFMESNASKLNEMPKPCYVDTWYRMDT